MSRSSSAVIERRALGAWWAGAGLALVLAVSLGVAAVQFLMAPSSRELLDLAKYLALSGAATLLASWLALRTIGRATGLTLRMKAFLGSTIATGVGLLNVLIVARFMFISTSHDLKLLIAFVGFAAVVSVAVSTWVAGYTAGRLGAVLDRIRSLAAGDYETELSLAGADEVALLAADVNRLSGRLRSIEDQRQNLERERRELTAAISHDLRTPLASLRAMAEALDDHVVRAPAEVKRYYRTMRRDVDRLSLMIDELFELARIDSGALQLDRKRIRLQEIAAEVADAMRAPALRKGISITLDVGDQPNELELDGARLERAVLNLVRNALDHTPKGGNVNLAVAEENGWAALRVTDTGEGIDAADLENVWTRFFRAEKSRQRQAQSTDGAGLGLAIVRGIVEAHGGRVSAESQRGQGATFTILLPTHES